MLARFFLFAGLLTALSDTVSGAELNDKDLKAARKIYVNKCAKCHKFYEPKAYTDPAWERWMSSMTRKSRLKPPQDDLLIRYLEAYRKGRIPSAR